MAKIAFTARKDPLLRDPSSVQPPPRARVDAAATDVPSGAARLPVPDSVVDVSEAARMHEQPRGVVAVSATPGVGAVPTARRSDSEARGDGQPAGREFALRVPLRPSRRRVQTSMSLPPDLWAELERLADGAGSTPGELLNAVLRNGFPDSPEAALASVERVLDRMPLDEGLLEERNYRLALEVREGLDRLSRMLTVGPRGRVHRSLLIRAILIDRTLATPIEARELINGLRVRDMRDSLAAANGAQSASAS